MGNGKRPRAADSRPSQRLSGVSGAIECCERGNQSRLQALDMARNVIDAVRLEFDIAGSSCEPGGAKIAGHPLETMCRPLARRQVAFGDCLLNFRNILAGVVRDAGKNGENIAPIDVGAPVIHCARIQERQQFMG